MLIFKQINLSLIEIEVRKKFFNKIPGKIITLQTRNPVIAGRKSKMENMDLGFFSFRVILAKHTLNAY